ncbi:MAG: DUF1178 family protein [Burkholderiales bacterium]|jgi:hypothetical protein|nr:DUF1178 family protein [Burkholderiales bacterium]
MILYDLICRNGHVFEVWLAGAGAFDAQKASGLLCCPICDNREVEKRLSAKVQSSKTQRERQEETCDAMPETAHSVVTPSGVAIKRLRELVRAVEDVGGRFPEEARKMHYEEIPMRPIRGQAGQSEIEELAEEGVEFDILPAFLLRELN